jgi:hypothetical protein
VLNCGQEQEENACIMQVAAGAEAKLFHVHFAVVLLLIRGFFRPMPPRILGERSKIIEESYKFSQKSETFGHQFNISNHNSH